MHHPPRFGIRLLDDLGSPRELVELAVLADRLGFDSVWYPHDTLRAHSWALASATAMATERIQVGSVGTNPWSTHPAEILTFLATLDKLSDGRAALGLGIHTTEHLAWIGIDPGDYVQGTREAYEILRMLLHGDGPAYDGDHFKLPDNAQLRMAPLRADIPIYICPFGEEYLELSGAIGYGSLPMMTPPESVQLMVEPILRGARQAGRDPADVDIAGLAWISISDSRASARDRLADVVAYFGSYLQADALATVGLQPEDFLAARDRIMVGDHTGSRTHVNDDMLRLGIVGTPEECRNGVQTLLDGGVTTVLLGGPLGPDPRNALTLLAEQVIPHFR